jgi:hypothetical protein
MQVNKIIDGIVYIKPKMIKSEQRKRLGKENKNWQKC